MLAIVLRGDVEESESWSIERLNHHINGASSVYNMTFTLFLFHLIIILMLLPKAECSRYIHDGGFCFKFILIVIIYGIFFLADE